MSEPYKLRTFIDINYSFASADAFFKSAHTASNLVSQVIPPYPSSSVLLFKFTSHNRVMINENFMLSFLVINMTEEKLNHITLIDHLDPSLYFIKNSIQINCAPIPGGNPNQGIFLDELAAKQFILISFYVRFQSLPQNNITTNYGALTYKTYSDTGTWVQTELKSNIIQLQVDCFKLAFGYKVLPYNSSNRTFIFSLRITNQSTLPLTSPKLFLNHSSHTHILPDTVYINHYAFPLGQTAYIPLDNLPIDYSYDIFYLAYTEQASRKMPSLSVYLEHAGGIIYPDYSPI